MERKPRQQRRGFGDVAKSAGVSIATVYRVASGNARVSKEVQNRVRTAAEKVGIELDRGNKPAVLAFLLSNREILHPFHSHVLVGAEAACTARGWDMLFQLFRYPANVPWKALHLPRILQRRDMVRGVVLSGTNYLNLLELLQHREIPFTVLGNNVPHNGRELSFDAVFSDDTQGTYEMTRYMQSLQHRDIWFVGNKAEPWSLRCIQGYERAMRESGLTCRVSAVESDNAIEVGYLGTKSLLAQGEPITAILCSTDEAVKGIYKAIKERGLNIPDDISVSGWNESFGSFLTPPVTIMREFPEQIGRRMVELVLNRIERPNLPPQQVTIPTELVERASCTTCGPARPEGGTKTIVPTSP